LRRCSYVWHVRQGSTPSLLEGLGGTKQLAMESQRMHVLDAGGQLHGVPSSLLTLSGHGRSVPLRSPMTSVVFPSGVTVAHVACGTNHSAVSFFSALLSHSNRWAATHPNLLVCRLCRQRGRCIRGVKMPMDNVGWVTLESP
jgi:hypothetical protein